MTVEPIERFAEQSARAHLEARHPAVTDAYATGVPRQAILLDLQEVGMCTCRPSAPGHGVVAAGRMESLGGAGGMSGVQPQESVAPGPVAPASVAPACVAPDDWSAPGSWLRPETPSLR